MYRSLFAIPRRSHETEWVYFCGHSLGAQPKAVPSYVRRMLEAWAWEGVGAYFSERSRWVDYADRLRPKLAPLLGTSPESIAIAHTLTTNMHLLLASFYKPSSKRYHILTEKHLFPTDRYALESWAAFHGYSDAIQELSSLIPSTEEVIQTIEHWGERLAGVWLSGVHYLTGQAMDIARITQAAHRVGAWAGWDLAHAVGNIPLALEAWKVDFAVWCSYKYLNAGPGAVGGMYVRPDLWNETRRLAGWWGNRLETRFLMRPEFDPAPDTRAWMHSNPSPLSLAALEASLDIFAQVDLPTYFAAVQKMHYHLRQALEAMPHVEVITPPNAHGAQVSFRLRTEHPRSIFETLLQKGFCVDWREPDIIRAAPVALYNLPEEIDAFAEALALYESAYS
ncbi:MAG: kynureninase [Bacteroidia bacterium]|nr:kynureninase [Bacteroidia bacterium]MDW8235740.1 kynureninase [Bacteroidia bacterium]MDW8417618.1 kynureninase [Bacteroidia bacterium]